MRYQPKSEKQIAEEGLLPVGVYGFEVYDALDRKSSKGNDMIELKLKLFDHEGNSCGMVTDYLLEKLAYKLRHAAVACGIGEKYEGGELVAHDFKDKMGEVKIRIQADKEGKYPDKNVVADYIVQKETNGDHEPPAGHPVNDPDMPF